jgi:hypothetical protein
MAKNNIYNKAISIGLFMFATTVFSFTGFNDIYAQTTSGNQSSGNQSETIGTLANLTGSDQGIISNDTTISNPSNNVGNSIGTNEFQSY